ncbi:cation diffusion facilitator family transporter [Klugiella xanthotipulae]|uniref:Putative Co/Zn/Cd cation transporter (Cation efflux family) n=1 Tax=Klugiella xanthotipulae TaxID=244735 RepID=A0A543I407_9MICO|nr:cation transporter [Klugiella xanthotipulae]TQM65281.1 putative Co/Zn/Cd cation transporter (cation efflux family) [Klugiella xanthotipulae]
MLAQSSPAPAATPSGPATERRALVESMAIALGVAVIAVAWGLLSGARIVLFDGVYVLLGIVLSWSSLLVSRTVQAGATTRFPFGRESLTPFAIAGQGLALLGTLIYAATDAVILIRDGGSDVAPAAVAGYGLLTALVGIVAAWRLPRVAPGSELIVAEAAQWRAGAALSVVMVLGAGAALLLDRTDLRSVVQYVDPVLVLMACALLAPMPIRLLRSGFNELLEAAPPAKIQESVGAIIEAVRAENNLDSPIVRMHKVGRRLYLEVDFVVQPGRWDVADEDHIRHAIINRVAPLGFDLWANVELTTDPTLTQ